MKRILHLLLLIGLVLMGNATQSASAQHTKTLHVFGLGSSFMEDLLTRLPALIPADADSLDIHFLYYAGAGLDDHYRFITEDSFDYVHFRYNTKDHYWQTDSCRFSDVIDTKPWDIFILQQSSQYSGNYDKISESLPGVIRVLSSHAPSAQFYWHMSWAFAKDSTHPSFVYYDNDQSKMYRSIVDAADKVLNIHYKTQFAGFIPSGAVIQTLRDSTALTASDDFTRDGYHLDMNLSRYAASCAFYESVLAKRFGHSILESTYVPTEDSLHTDLDYALVREIAYNVVHNDSLVWNILNKDKIYKSRYYDRFGRLLGGKPGRQPYIRQDFYISGKKEGNVIIQTEK